VNPALQDLPRRALRRYVFRAMLGYLLLALVVAVAWLVVFGSFLGLLAFLFVPPSALYGWLSFTDSGWAFEEDRLVVRYRSLGRKTAIAPRRRLQSREVTRSPFQRRVRLATFLAEVASGSGGSALRVTDLDAKTAEILAGNLGPQGAGA
jgi:putative membrane protein